MKRTIINTIVVVLAAVLLGGLSACKNELSQRKNVLIVLSYDDQHRQYAGFIDEVEDAIENGGYIADTKVVYMDLEYSPDAAYDVLQQMNDSLERMGWIPDVIISENDRTGGILLSERGTRYFNMTNTPVVLGSIHFPQVFSLQGRPNICMWTDPIDFYENIKLATTLSSKNHVQIELDNYIYDVLIRRELFEDIGRPPFVVNENGRLGEINDQILTDRYKDSIVVSILKIDNGVYDIKHPTDSIVRRREQVRSFLKLSSKYPSLVVKKDLYGDAIANNSNHPQFTCITSDFADGMGSYLAGYFANYKTIAHDCGFTAARIFNGANPASLSGKTHRKYFWMDYDAMQKLGMSYDDYKDKYRIVNAPYEVEHPTLFLIINIVVVVFILLILFGLWLVVQKIRKHLVEKKLEVIARSRNISRLCLNSIENMPIETVEDIEKYLSLSHPESKPEIDLVRDSLGKPGSYSYLIYCAPKGDEQYQWWEFRYDITPSGAIGLVINKQDSVLLQERVEQVKRNSKEASRKETFFNNLSKELKKPLDDICNACDKLVNADLAEKERKNVLATLKNRSEFAAQEIGDILLFSRIESGRVRYMITEKEAGAFLEPFYREIAPKVPANLTFVFIPGRPKVFPKADYDRLRNVLTQFVLNAVKFTKKGEIMMGWRYYLDSHECEFFVEDTGVGISNEVKDKLFDLFWKADEVSEGIGLGLNICRSLAEAMKGRLTVGSIPGKGSRFSIWLPARAEGQ